MGYVLAENCAQNESDKLAESPALAESLVQFESCPFEVFLIWVIHKCIYVKFELYLIWVMPMLWPVLVDTFITRYLLQLCNVTVNSCLILVRIQLTNTQVE